MKLTILTLIFCIIPFFDLYCLDGCRSPEDIAKRIEILRGMEWMSISSAQLTKQWPDLVINKDCSTSVPALECFFVLDIQRLIDPNCQCCITFSFEKNDQNETLKEVMFYFTAENYTDALQFLKKTIPATGIKATFTVDEQKVKMEQNFEEDWEAEISGALTKVAVRLYSFQGLWRSELAYAEVP